MENLNANNSADESHGENRVEDEQIAAETDAPTAPILNIVSHPGNIKMEKFDGKTSWKLYHRQFDRISKMNNWQHQMTDYLWIHLTADALAFMEETPGASVMTYDEMCNALDGRFGAERLSNVYKAQLLNRRRKSGETLSELGQDMRRLVNNAYPNFNSEAKEEIAVEKFLDALNADTRRTIYQENPTTLNQAIEKGLKIEAWGIVEETKHGKTTIRVAQEPKAEEVIDNENIRLLKDLQQKVNDMQIKRKDPRGFSCYYCGKPGHISRECHSRKRDEDARLPQKGSRLTCYRCGGRGHKSSDCPTPEND